MKKSITAILAVAGLVGLVGCGSNEGKKEEAGSPEYEKIVYSYATFNNIPDAETLDTIEEAINEISREKIGVEVELLPIGIAEYSSNISLAMQGGDQIDIFQTLGNLNNNIASGMTLDITELAEKYAKETKDVVGDDFLSTTMQDGKLYAIPTYKSYALTPMVIYRKDIAEELNIDMTKVKDVYDLTDVFRTVKEAHPNMTGLAPIQTGDLGITRSMAEIDSLTDDWFSRKGVLIGDDMTVKDLYSDADFKKRAELAREWFQEGLVMKDAATTTSTNTELMSSGNSFSSIASYGYSTDDTAELLSAQTNVELAALEIGESYLSTDSINAVSWSVAATSKVPEAATKFLNLTFTDEDIVNLLIWGIKDRDYVLSDDGYASYPEGETAATVPYTAQLSNGTLGNGFLPHPLAGTSKEALEWQQEQNQIAKKSPAMGFTFDASSLKTEYSTVGTVISQYLPGILTGSVEPEATIKEFVDKLNSSGYEKILEEKQKQLDAWAKENK